MDRPESAQHAGRAGVQETAGQADELVDAVRQEHTALAAADDRQPILAQVQPAEDVPEGQPLSFIALTPQDEGGVQRIEQIEDGVAAVVQDMAVDRSSKELLPGGLRAPASGVI